MNLRLPAIAAAAPERIGAAAPGNAHTVLIVEDNDDERETLRVALELAGHRVIHAASGQAALAEMRRARPSVAFIDIGLPDMDGYALARSMRSQHDGPLALFALTGYAAAADVERAKQAGFDRHLTKPVEVNELAAIVSHAVS